MAPDQVFWHEQRGPEEVGLELPRPSVAVTTQNICGRIDNTKASLLLVRPVHMQIEVT